MELGGFWSLVHDNDDNNTDYDYDYDKDRGGIKPIWTKLTRNECFDGNIWSFHGGDIKASKINCKDEKIQSREAKLRP